MAIRTTISCPHCRHTFGTYQRVFRKESGPLVVECPTCYEPIDLRGLAVEWELLTESERALRYISTAIVAIVSGGGLGLLVVIIGSMFLADSMDSPVHLPVLPLIAVSCVIGGWMYWRMLRTDVEGSRRRLADPNYRELLREIGTLCDEQNPQGKSLTSTATKSNPSRPRETNMEV